MRKHARDLVMMVEIAELDAPERLENQAGAQPVQQVLELPRLRHDAPHRQHEHEHPEQLPQGKRRVERHRRVRDGQRARHEEQNLHPAIGARPARRRQRHQQRPRQQIDARELEAAIDASVELVRRDVHGDERRPQERADQENGLVDEFRLPLQHHAERNDREERDREHQVLQCIHPACLSFGSNTIRRAP